MNSSDPHPTVTLAEAMTRIAFGKSVEAKVLRRFQRRHNRTLWPAAEAALEAVGQQLAQLAYAGKLDLRGRLQERKDGPEGARSTIPSEIFGDVVHLEPLKDVIEMDVLLGDHWAYQGYPRYRNIRLDPSQAGLDIATQPGELPQPQPVAATSGTAATAQAAEPPPVAAPPQHTSLGNAEIDQVPQPSAPAVRLMPLTARRVKPAFARALAAIEHIYPAGVPSQVEKPNSILCRDVGGHLQTTGKLGVSDDTILRAAGRRN